MVEKALRGSRAYWSWLLFLLAVMAVGLAFYLWQALTGAEASGLSRDVPWGFFIANYTFMVGVAASAVMVVLPYYLHNQKDFGKITALGEFLAVAAVTTTLLFIMADLGQPGRAFNILIYATPNSPFFWNTIILPGYLLINLVTAWFTLDAERHGVLVPGWVRLLILISIPWAVSIHTMTSFVYSGLPARPLWNSAILTPRFLASAFASGPALLIILTMAVRKFTGYDVGSKAIQKLALIVTYATIINLFLVLAEVFAVVYSNIGPDMESLQYLYFGLGGKSELAPFMWLSTLLSVAAIALLVNPATRRNERTLLVACAAVFFSMWIDKGLCLVVGGFIPSPLGGVTEYVPTVSELVIASAIYAAAAFMLTLLYKIAVGVKEEVAA
jgi:molybdopterin-containing oxidoreductase family membrane subunit